VLAAEISGNAMPSAEDPGSDRVSTATGAPSGQEAAVAEASSGIALSAIPPAMRALPMWGALAALDVAVFDPSLSFRPSVSAFAPDTRAGRDGRPTTTSDTKLELDG